MYGTLRVAFKAASRKLDYLLVMTQSSTVFSTDVYASPHIICYSQREGHGDELSFWDSGCITVRAYLRLMVAPRGVIAHALSRDE